MRIGTIMTKPSNLNLIVKFDTSSVPDGGLPSTIKDNYENSFSSYGNITKMSTEFGNYLNCNGANNASKLTTTSIPNFKATNFEFEIKLSFSSLKVINTIYSYGTGSTAFVIRAKNTYKDGLTINIGTYSLSTNISFAIDVDYVISVTKEDNVYSLYINGMRYGFIDSSVLTNAMLSNATNPTIIGNSVNGSSGSTEVFNGKIYYFNISYGPTLLHYNSYTNHAEYLLSALNFRNRQYSATGTNLNFEIETAKDSGFKWEYNEAAFSFSNGYAKSTGSGFTSNYQGNFDLITDFLKNDSVTDLVLVDYYDKYKLTMTTTIPLLPEPEVIINEYTTSALNFEDGIFDQVETTLWNKEGTGDITAVNHIFGFQSFETKVLGDSLYTTSNIITGGSAPFTIEFYINVNKDQSQMASNTTSDLPIFTNPFATHQGLFITSPYRTDGTTPWIFRLISSNGTVHTNTYFNTKNNVSENNKITLSYDGAAIRLFLNNVLIGVYGSLIGIYANSNPIYFYKNLFNSAITSTKGLIDNVNIFDGEARVVRDPDPYEEYLIVDLAFDGENNSTKIVDNGILKSSWPVYGTSKISTNQKFDGFSSLYLDGTGGIRSESQYVTNTDTVTISFDTIQNRLNENVYYDTYDGSYDGGFQLIHYNDTFGIWYSNIFESAGKTLTIGEKFNIVFTYENGFCKLYINGILCISKNLPLNFKNKYAIGGQLVYPNPNYYSDAYIKNFKIYKGVAVIPENPTGKIQLDFDNNLIDKYNNSNWTNNGVTFDQVNSVKGNSAYFNGSSYITSASNQNLNFENKSFKIQMDFKSTNTTKAYSVLLATGHTSSGNNKILNLVYGSSKGFYFNKENILTISAYNVLANQYYNTELIRKNGTLFLKLNDNIVGVYNSDTEIIDYSEQGTTIGAGRWGSSLNHTGYIDNFKSYKEDLLSKIDIYSTVSSSYTVINGDKLSLTVSQNQENIIKFKDCPNVKNFKAKFKIKNISGLDQILFRTTNWSTVNAGFGYCVNISDTTIGLGKGSNSQSGSWAWIITNSIPKPAYDTNVDRTYEVTIICNELNIKVYINDILYIDKDDSTHLVSGQLGIRKYGEFSGNHTTEFISMDIFDLNENLLYHNDLKSKIDNVIDKPAVHLPLETNATNVGFTPLIVNSVGSPTYTTIDNKKCIKFESGKYLNINSNNIFNLGTSSDFYIETYIYINRWLPSSGLTNNRVFILSTIDTDTFGFRINQTNNFLEIRVNNINTPINSTIFELNKTYNIKIFRKGSTLYSTVNDNNLQSIVGSFDINTNNLQMTVGGVPDFPNTSFDGYMSNFKMFVGTSEIPETYNDKKVLDLDFKPTRKSYLFKDNNNMCVIHPVNITQRDYQDSQYACTFNGTNQHLQLGKNDLLNFGLDDFILEVKLKYQIDANNYKTILSGGSAAGASENTSIMIISDKGISQSVFTGGIHFKINGNVIFNTGTNTVLPNIIYTLLIQRINNVFYLYLDDILIDTNSLSNDYCNFNFSSNTLIGKIGHSTTENFNGTIYSIKVLRNTTDLSLLLNEEEINVEGATKEFTLSNGEYSENVILDAETGSNDTLIFKSSDDEVSANINGYNLFVPKVDTQGAEPILKAYHGFNGTIYNMNVIDGDIPPDATNIFEFEDKNHLLEREYPEVVILSDEQRFIVLDQGDFIVDGFIEGANNPSWSIYNKLTRTTLISGTGDYYYDGLDPLYVDDYVIINNETKTEHKINKVPMVKGIIEIYVPNKGCVDADFCIRLFRRSDSVFIGEYEINQEICVIGNLDCSKSYDAILFDRNTKLSSRVLDDRTPSEEQS